MSKMDATSFEAISALHELKYRNLRQDDRNFVLSILEKYEKGEPLTNSESASLNPSTIPAPANGSSTLTLTTSGAAAGTYVIVIAGTGITSSSSSTPNLTQIATLKLRIS